MKKLIKLMVIIGILTSNIYSQIPCIYLGADSNQDENFSFRRPGCPVLKHDVSVEIPVIVHVLYNDDYENVGYDEVVDMINDFNDKMYSKEVSTTDDPDYQDYKVNVSIQLKLADKNGTCTPGYERIFIDKPWINANTWEENFTEDERIKINNIWDPKHYLNVWIVKSIDMIYDDGYGNDVPTKVFGYVPYIDPDTDAYTGDGITLDDDYLYDFIHEFGHYLGLYHLWKGNCHWPAHVCNKGDMVSDTPTKEGALEYVISENMCDEWLNGFESDTVTISGKICLFSGPNYYHDPTVNNYMTYQYNCWTEFTSGQYRNMVEYLEGARLTLIEEYAEQNIDMSDNKDYYIEDLLNVLGLNNIDELCNYDKNAFIDLGGNLIINTGPNQQVCFNNLKFVMDENAMISVINNSKLSINNARIYNCDNFWKYIFVESGSTINLSNSVIERALKGLFAEKGANITIDNCIFDNNAYGVYLSANGSGNQANIDVNETRFTSDDTYFYLSTDIVWDRPFAGIYIDGHDYINLSAQEGKKNHYKRLSNGIIAYNSRLKVENSIFEDIYSDYGDNFDNGGCAIKIDGGVNSSQISKNEITDSKYGIGIINTNVKVEKNKLYDVEQGILLVRVGDFDIRENEIKAEERGIYIGFNRILIHGDYILGSTLSRNYVTISGFEESAKAMEYEEVKSVSSDNNWLTINSNDAGFYIANSYDCQFYDNTIDILGNDSDVTTDAIHIDDSDHIWVENSLLQDYTAATDNNGISAFGSQGSYYCNYTFYFDNGMKFFDDCDGSYIRSNNYNYNQRDLVLGLEDGTGVANSDSWVGTQGSIDNLKGNGNEWLGSDSRAQNSSPELIVKMSTFYVNAYGDQKYQPKIINAEGEWFLNNPDIKNENWCNGDDPGTDLPWRCTDIIMKIQRIDTMSKVGDCKKQMWLYKYYKKLIELKKENKLSEECIKFLNSKKNNVMVNIANVSLALDSLSLVQTSDTNLLNGLNNLTSLLDSLHTTRNINSEEWNQTVSSYTNVLKEYQDKDNGDRNGRRTKIDSLKNVITTISVKDSCLQILLDVFKIKANLLKSDTLSSAELVYLEIIAKSCPTDLGYGVFSARSMLSLYKNIRYPHIEECVSGDLIQRSVSQEKNKKLKVYPNPANNRVNILVNLEKNETGMIKIMDINGNILEKRNVGKESNKYKINTESFVSGIYFIKYNSNTGIRKMEKLIILRK